MSLKEDVLRYIQAYPGVTDRELSSHFHKIHQYINQTCRALEKAGRVTRQINPSKGLIGNYPAENAPPPAPVPKRVARQPAAPGEPLQEEAVKQVLYDYLTANGWTAQVAWGHTHGVDIAAEKDGKKWFIEVKGPGSRPPMRVNYFIGILGETLQRMDDPAARYSIAFPDMPQFRNLWSRLPALAKARTTIDMLLVDTDGAIAILS